MIPDFRELSLAVNLSVFTAAAAVVWLAGTRVAGYAATIAERSGISKAVVGTILLGGITSLPEIATTGTAAAGGNAALAVNNLLGGVAMQVAVLAIADAAIGKKGALSAVVPRPTVLLQGTLNILLLAMIVLGITAGDVSVLGVGVWALGVTAAYVVAIALIARSNSAQAWQPAEPAARAAPQRSRDRRPTRRIAGYTALAAIAIFAAGFLLARTGEALADQTGLGSSFVGAVLVAVSTSLPEVSSTVAAVRLGQFELAFADIFGTNLFDLALVSLADAAYPGGPVFNEVGGFSVAAAMLGMLVTGIYLGGLIERRDKVIFRLGVDSLLVLLVYAGGLVLLYHLRG